MYSQTGELEKLLDRFFLGKRLGFFLEIGAWDAKDLSQTYYLEQKYGWKGLCVDPFPNGFADRSCQLCAKAVSSDGRDREFIRVTTDKSNSGNVSYLSGFNSNVYHWEFIQEHCNYETLFIETITVLQLYRKYKLPHYIDFLSVDTEGAEVEIFASWDLDTFRFGMISFEHNNDSNVKAYVGKLLQKHGYMFHASMGIDGIEDIYISEGLNGLQS